MLAAGAHAPTFDTDRDADVDADRSADLDDPAGVARLTLLARKRIAELNST